MSSDGASEAKRSTARMMRAATAPAVRPVQVVRTSARPSSPSMRVPSRRSVTPSVTQSRTSPGSRVTVCSYELQVLHDAQQRLRFGGRLDRAVLAQAERQRVAGADDLQDRAAVLLGPQLAVEEGQEAAAGALVEDGGVEAFQDRRAAEALAGQQAQGVPGEAGDRGGLRARAADVADGEAVGAVADREEVVEVAADLVALAGRAVDDLDLDAVDAAGAPAAAGCAGGTG